MAGEGSVLVVAGAGTGKTKTLAYRVAHLVCQGEDTYPNILKLYLPSNRLVFFEKDGWPMIKINTWMGDGLLVVVPLSENLARIAGSGGNHFVE